MPLSRGRHALIDSPNSPGLDPAFRQRLIAAIALKWTYTQTQRGHGGYAYRSQPKLDAKGHVCRQEAGYTKTNKRKRRGRIIYTTVYLHRYLMQDQFTPQQPQVDHISGDGLDCRYSNMRPCSQMENNRNRHKRQATTSSSKFKGVGLVTNHGSTRFLALIKHLGKDIYLGRFRKEIDAAHAYNQACIQYHGAFARPNDPALMDSGGREI